MLSSIWSESVTWWRSVPPEFAFLLALPFLVALTGLVADCIRHRCGTNKAGRTEPTAGRTRCAGRSRR
jgi:hypothetical protein